MTFFLLLLRVGGTISTGSRCSLLWRGVFVLRCEVLQTCIISFLPVLWSSGHVLLSCSVKFAFPLLSCVTLPRYFRMFENLIFLRVWNIFVTQTLKRNKGNWVRPLFCLCSLYLHLVCTRNFVRATILSSFLEEAEIYPLVFCISIHKFIFIILFLLEKGKRETLFRPVVLARPFVLLLFSQKLLLWLLLKVVQYVRIFIRICLFIYMGTNLVRSPCTVFTVLFTLLW